MFLSFRNLAMLVGNKNYFYSLACTNFRLFHCIFEKNMIHDKIMHLRYILLIISCLFVTFSTMATPAFRGLQTRRQSDGTILTYYQTGDEYFHYYCTADGKPIVREANGDFSYAILDSNMGLVSSNCLAHDKGTRSSGEQSLLAANSYAGIEQALHAMAMKRRMASTKGVLPTSEFGEYAITQAIKPVGEINVPIILVQFQDVKFTFDKTVIGQNYNGSNFTGLHGKGVGSVRDYFITQSDSIFQPNFVVLDVVTLSQNMEYYGANDSKGDDKHPEEIIVEACKALDSSVDFSKFDNNADGEVEFVYCVYAGYSESYGAPASTIWPHQWTLSATNKVMTLDGVKINTYAASGELAYNEATQGDGPKLDGIGSCCHEFSHCLGLPDFYDTSGRSYANFGMDYWDLMDYGCYNADGYVPIGYNAYERDFMGWRKLETLTERGDYSMKALTSGGKGYKIVNDANKNEYYILENRQAEGFDTHIFNSGMLVIHVDYSPSIWAENEVNYNLARQRFTIIPADNKQLTYYRAKTTEEYHESLRGDVWPGTTGNRELTNSTTPAAKVYSGDYMNKSIRNISESNGEITFSFMKDSLEIPQLTAIYDIKENAFTLNWKRVKYASGYEVELIKVEKVTESDGDIFTLLTEDFLGCSLSGSDITDNIDSYTINPGWTGFNLWSETGVLRLGTKNEYGELATPYFPTVADGSVTVRFNAKKYDSSDGRVRITLSSEFYDTGASDYDTFTISDKWETYWYTFSKEGSRASLLFSTEGGEENAARVLIDEINVTQESTEREVSCGFYVTSDTSYTFTALQQGKYRCWVRALDKDDAGITSEFSEKLEVVVGSNTAVAAPNDDVDSYIEVYSLAGVSVYKGTDTSMPRLKQGCYVVRRHGESRKLYIK